MMTRRSWFVYGTLLAIWVMLLGWQVAEHLQVRRSLRATLRHRAEDISNTLALIMRTTSRGPFVSKERIEAWLDELVKQGEVSAIKLFNIEGEELVSAGGPIELPKEDLPALGYWDNKTETVTLMNLVDLGTNIISSFTNRPPPPRMETNEMPSTNLASPNVAVSNVITSTESAIVNSTNISGLTNSPNGTNENRPRFGPRRPPRFTPAEIEALRAKKSAHGFIMVMSSHSVTLANAQDIWLRCFIGLLASIAVAGYGLAWSNAHKTSDLQIRLVRASELNSHLKEMNLAAAGLAHETRNPLNIVRGLAQMISKQEDASPEIRIKSKEIIDETDRVAAQLNEFINYSRPREVRRAATRLNSVVGEVVRALNYDIEEKQVQVQNLAEDLMVEADEQLLRQALFNLVINAVEAVSLKGEIQIRTGRQGNGEAFIEIVDNGPGVAAENRREIFKPYFTTHEDGTGLGLAVVQQIILAHGWEIECLANQPSGAIFRITHVKLPAKG